MQKEAVDTLLVGAGLMAREHYKVLKALDRNVLVIGRGEKSAEAFKEELGAEVYRGSIGELKGTIDSEKTCAIVAVSELELLNVSKQLVDLGIKRILIEKPVSYSLDKIKEFKSLADEAGCEIVVGYNRRFYSSVKKAMEIIEEDGGVSSFNFEFTEWTHVIQNVPKPEEVKENILISNSSHVIDLAFFLGGLPDKMVTFTRGGLEWHPSGSIYAGAGVTKENVLFSYSANWEAPGRWGVEIMTKKHRLYFRPLESLQIQELASVKVNEVSIENELDIKYKPGLYEMLRSFCDGIKDERACTLAQHIEHFNIYDQIRNGNM